VTFTGYGLLLCGGSREHDLPGQSQHPWAVKAPDSYYLPVILHKHMIALKCHLFPSTTPDDWKASVRSVSHLPFDYGRSLRPNIMAHDALYSLTEVFNFAASSQMELLNLIDIKIHKYTSLPTEQDFQSLPNLKYTKQMLYRYIQKTQRIIESIKNAKQDKWPKDSTEPGSRRAVSAAQNLEQDFQHLLDRAEMLHRLTTEAITVLFSSISISESQKAMEQAQRVGKLTFLAFVFVPLSFTTGFFGMNVAELAGNKIGLRWWVCLSVLVTSAAVALFFLDFIMPTRRAWGVVQRTILKLLD
jgi:Mg2+ and Co2+ transporter CorA